MKKYLPVLGFVLFVLIGTGIAKIFRENRMKNFAITTARVIAVDELPKSGGSVFVRYKFTVDRNEFVQYEAMQCPKLKADAVRGIIGRKLILIAYKKDSPGSCEMLISKSMFDYYNVRIPREYQEQIEVLDSICNIK